MTSWMLRKGKHLSYLNSDLEKSSIQYDSHFVFQEPLEITCFHFGCLFTDEIDNYYPFLPIPTLDTIVSSWGSEPVKIRSKIDPN